MQIADEIPNNYFKQFTLKSGRKVRVWGNGVLEAFSDIGEWRIVNDKIHPRFAAAILEIAFDQWDESLTEPYLKREPE